jgi:hypothetical protein
MFSTVHDNRRPRSRRRALIVALALALGIGAVYLLGCYMDCEYVHWPTIWQASRAQTPSGVRVAALIQTRTASQSARPHWHHCGWCETVYAYAEHFAIKVTVSESEAYLFDWDATTRRLVPITVRTAEVFPELIPSGSQMERLSDHGLDGQFQNDRPCRIVPRREMP